MATSRATSRRGRTWTRSEIIADAGPAASRRRSAPGRSSSRSGRRRSARSSRSNPDYFEKGCPFVDQVDHERPGRHRGAARRLPSRTTSSTGRARDEDDAARHAQARSKDAGLHEVHHRSGREHHRLPLPDEEPEVAGHARPPRLQPGARPRRVRPRALRSAKAVATRRARSRGRCSTTRCRRSSRRVRGYQYNPKQASQLLQAAGYSADEQGRRRRARLVHARRVPARS